MGAEDLFFMKDTVHETCNRVDCRSGFFAQREAFGRFADD
jgi:hypothetical protein